MSLLSYKEVRPWAKSIREATARRQMPPWFADPKHGDFSNNASLSQKDIDTLAAWAQAGAPEGDVKDLPPNPKFVTQGRIASFARFQIITFVSEASRRAAGPRRSGRWQR